MSRFRSSFVYNVLKTELSHSFPSTHTQQFSHDSTRLFCLGCFSTSDMFIAEWNHACKHKLQSTSRAKLKEFNSDFL